MRPTASALLLFAFTPLCGVAAPADPRDKIDAYVTAEMKREHIPGLALGIYRRGEILKAQGYGLANVELDVPVKPETVFQSGSVGKQFAATAIMMLVEEGKDRSGGQRDEVLRSRAGNLEADQGEESAVAHLGPRRI
jgi:CubicO group peptidase (beta-lactamase class C family)